MGVVFWFSSKIRTLIIDIEIASKRWMIVRFIDLSFTAGALIISALIRFTDLSFTAGTLIHDALSKLYCATRKNEIASQIRDLLKAEDAPEKIHIISQYLELLETNSSSEKRQDHEDWFEGESECRYMSVFVDKLFIYRIVTVFRPWKRTAPNELFEIVFVL